MVQNQQIFYNSVVSDVAEPYAVKLINNGEFLKVLQLPVLKNIVFCAEEEEDVVKIWKLNVEKCAGLCDSHEKKLEFLAVGTSSLLLFVQQNWTGPSFKLQDLSILNYENETVLLKHRICMLEELVMDGESVVAVTQYPELLLLSRLILLECHRQFKLNITLFWLLRCFFIHQEVLEESSSKLFDAIISVMKEIESVLDENQNSVLTEQYLEFARIYLYYSYVQNSKSAIEKALNSSGIQTSLIGALGKRTKFQQEDLAQLILKVNVVNEDLQSDHDCETSLPIDVNLEDEVRLNKIKFKNDCDGKHPDLTGLQQAVILGIFTQTQKSQPKDSLADEELQPLISCILERTKAWSIKLTALLLRSRLESNHKRSVERAMMQLQTLVDSIDSDEPAVKDRFRYFFISYEPPKWEIESSLARIMLSMGAIKSALDIYLKLEEWENVIYCYNALDMRQKAREIIEQELRKHPTPKLWCLLGDATEDVSHYETAWKLSNEGSARAQRHWAMFYYKRQEYGKSIKHFELSLEKNSLQSELWYRLGYAALHEESWEVSAAAYRRYCVLDPECFEAWNNLARCYCELKQKRRAWRALQEALKVDYSNWRVWDNYMLVSADLREFDEVVRSYHQVLNLKEKHVDIPILKAVVYGFREIESELENKTESSENEATIKDLSKFREKLLGLFGRLTSQVLSNPDLWHLYSEIVASDTVENRLKKQQLLTKAYSAAISKQGWMKTTESCKDVLHILSKLIDVSLAVGQRNTLLSCQMSVRGCLTTIKKEYPGSDLCNELDARLLLLEESINDRNS